ncbi:MAG: hypothetical protein ABNH00_06215 [Dokdonia sp.]|jgi:hypothetical protein
MDKYIFLGFIFFLVACAVKKQEDEIKRNEDIIYQFITDAGRVSKEMVLSNDFSFTYRRNQVCDPNLYLGSWLIEKDTIKLSIEYPDIYSIPFEYEVEYFDTPRRKIKITEEVNDDISLFSFSTYLSINEDNTEAAQIIDANGEMHIDNDILINCIYIYFPPPYGNFRIPIEDIATRSINVKIKSIPETYCVLPKNTKWLKSNDSIYRIDDKTIVKSNFLIKN